MRTSVPSGTQHYYNPMKRLNYIFAILLLLAAIQAAGQDMVIEQVCKGAKRIYRVEGEQGSAYTWMLYNSSDNELPLPNKNGRNFTQTDPDGETHYLNEISIQLDYAGVYRLKVIQESANYCDTTDQGFIEVYDQPFVIANNPPAICTGEKVNLNNATASNYGSLLWTTSGDGTFDAPTALHTAYNTGPNDQLAGQVQLTLTAFGKGGTTTCTPATSTVTSTFRIIPRLVINDPAPVCAPETIDLSLATVTQGSDADLGNFEYFADEMATVPLANFKAVDRPGTYYIRGTNSYGCSVIQPVNVKFNKLIVPNFASIPDVCLNDPNPPILPPADFNGISGRWDPPVINTSVEKSEIPFTFTPDPGQCADKITIKVNVSKSITPTFTPITICRNMAASDLPALPEYSNNGIRGTWSPETISTNFSGPYKFTPIGGCGAQTDFNITIVDGYSTLLSNYVMNVCENSPSPAFPTVMNNVSGKWSTTEITTMIIGNKDTYTYVFNPDDPCYKDASLIVTINRPTAPKFDQIGPLCNGATPPLLPTISLDGISGTWSPATISPTKSQTYTFTPEGGCAVPATMSIEVYDPLQIDVNYQPIATYGGSTTVTVTASGGSGSGYTGVGTFVLASGSHTFTVTDGKNCEQSKTIFISEPQDFDVQARIINLPPCFSGNAQIQATASGGTAPYSFNVFRGDQLFISGTGTQNTFFVPASTIAYHFEVTDAANKRASSNELEITEPPKIELSYTATETSCAGMNDGTATIQAKFGQPPYSYAWSNGQTTQTATGLPSGTHRVIVYDQLDCYRDSVDVVISDPSIKTLQASAIPPKCSGEPGTLLFTFTNVPDGAYDISYDGGRFNAVEVRSNTASVPAMPETYNNLKLAINGCSTANGVSATVNSIPPITINANNVAITQPGCTSSGVIVVRVPAPNSGYLYSNDNGLSFKASNTFTNLATGTYRLRVKNIVTGCVSDPLDVVINPAPNAPSAPVIASITNTDCSTPLGSITLSGLPATGTWKVTASPGGTAIIGTGTTVTFNDLAPNSYTFNVSDDLTNCISSPSARAVINSQPVTPVAPVIDLISSPDCLNDKGSVSFSGLPTSGTWRITAMPGGKTITGNGPTGVFSGLDPNTYTFTVTDISSTCTSPASATVEIKQKPPVPAAPLAGVPTIPDCKTPTASLELSGLPSGTWTVTWESGTINGFGASTIISGLEAAKTFNFTVTNADGCTSAATKVVIAPQQLPPPDLVTLAISPECEEIPVKTMDANKAIVPPPSGTIIQWYDLNGNLVATPVLSMPGTVTYYAEAVMGNCVSINRSPVTLTILDTPDAPISLGDMYGCENGGADALDARDAIEGDLSKIRWYDSATGGNEVKQPIRSTLGSSTYYAEAFSGTCTNPNRTPVTLIIDKLPAKPIVTVSKKPTCNDENGIITVTNPPLGSGFKYSIDGGDFVDSPVFENKRTGKYSLWVQNSLTGCISDTTVIHVPAIPPAPALSVVSFENPECFGDSFKINLSMTTTIPPGKYTFWYDGGQFDSIQVANNKATISGVITETVKEFKNLRFEANGCTSTGDPDVTIESPAELEIRIVKVLEQSLKGIQKGAIDIVASGGTGTLKFNWSNGATSEDLDDIAFGNYTVTVSDDKNCTALKEIRVPLNNPPVALADTFTFTCLSVTGDLLENDYDPDPAEQGDFITINEVPVTKPLYALEFIINPDGTFNYKAITGYSGIDFFVYEIVDKLGQTATARVDLNVISDFDGDGIADGDDPDADGDGILNVLEAIAGQDWQLADADGDGKPNFLDIDSDNDGIVDHVEAQPKSPGYVLPSNLDVNNNGVDDAYDTHQFTPELKPVDSEKDGIPDFMDVDSDNDGVPDYLEGHDGDSNGRADISATGKDSDGDGLDNAFDTVVNECNVLGNAIGSIAALQDTDSDGIPDWRDDNDDDDLYPTKFEDLNADNNWANDDVDFDGIPEYLDYGRECDMFIPDIFTPNGDNIHDYFQVYCINHYPNAKMYIFDQVGNKIFEREKYGNLDYWGTVERACWNGRAELGVGRSTTARVPVGTYYYVLDLGNGEVKKSFVYVSY